jgi:hypothetical protein
MIETLLLGLFAVAWGGSEPAVAGRDTTFVVPAGAQVQIFNADGDILVRAVDGGRGRALIEDEDDGHLRVRRSGNVFEIRPVYGDGDMLVELPAGVSLEVFGGDGDIEVRGFRGSVVVETFDGDVVLNGASIAVVRSVDGDVLVRDVSGSVTVDMGDGEASLNGVGGPIVVNGIDGDIAVRNADARAVVLSTISGSLFYDGEVYEGGEYELATHDGDVTFALPEGVGATVSVFTYDGALIPSFPLQLRGAIGSVAEFTLGNGSAQVRLESFDGNIHLIRPGERSPDNR